MPLVHDTSLTEDGVATAFTYNHRVPDTNEGDSIVGDLREQYSIFWSEDVWNRGRVEDQIDLIPSDSALSSSRGDE